MGATIGSILVAGAINTDLVASVARAPAAGETVTGSAFSIHGGGKGANQAVAASRSGGSVFLAGAVGNDQFGRDRLAALRADGVDTFWVLDSEHEPSGVALVIVDEGGENRIAYVPGATRTVPPDHLHAAFAEIRPSYVLATNELPLDALRTLFTVAQNAGSTVAFNATPDPATAQDLVQDVSILIVNEGEAAALLDIEQIADPEDAVASLLVRGPSSVVLTLGPAGAFFGTAGEITWHRPPKVKVVDTTGAGDTFCGALVAELAGGATLNDAVRYGVGASALSVTRMGAQSSIPTRVEIVQP